MAAHGGEHAAVGEHGATEHGAAMEVIREGMEHPALSTEWGLFGVALLVFLVGLGMASWAYGGLGERARRLGQMLAYPRRLLHRKWFVDEVYQRLLIGPFWALSRFFDGTDRRVVDGAVNLSAAVSELSGQVIKLFQTGIVRHYALWLLSGAVMVIWLMTK